MKFSFKDIGKKPDISQTNLNDNKYLEDEDIGEICPSKMRLATRDHLRVMMLVLLSVKW